MTKKPSEAHLVETLLDGDWAFRGNFLQLRREQVRLPDGKRAEREFIVHPGAVMVVPLLDDGRLLLERQYRHPIGQVMLEFPAGKLDAGEDPLACGQRELLEETGYRAREWAYAGLMHNAIAYSTEAIHVFFARGLVAGERRLDEGEFLDLVQLTQAELELAALNGDITDAKTLVGLLWLQRGQAQLAWADVGR